MKSWHLYISLNYRWTYLNHWSNKYQMHCVAIFISTGLKNVLHEGISFSQDFSSLDFNMNFVYYKTNFNSLKLVVRLSIHTLWAQYAGVIEHVPLLNIISNQCRYCKTCSFNMWLPFWKDNIKSVNSSTDLTDITIFHIKQKYNRRYKWTSYNSFDI